MFNLLNLLCLDEGDEKENDDKLKQPSIESSRRENTLVLRLTNKEQELQDCMVSALNLFYLVTYFSRFCMRMHAHTFIVNILI